ncbi:DUF6288 domain-containing protein [Planctomycetota bacterium]
MLIRSLTLTFTLVLILSSLFAGNGTDGPEADDYNLGFLGARAEAMPEVPGTENGGVRIIEIYPGLPLARAKIRKGDILIEVDGEYLSKDENCTWDFLGRIENYLSGKKKNVLISYVRNGKTKKARIILPVNAHGKECPQTCRRCQNAVTNGLEFLKSDQNQEDSFKNCMLDNVPKIVINCIAGLSFLASGSTREKGIYSDNINSCINYVTKTAGAPDPYLNDKPNIKRENWTYSIATIFLCECYHQNRDEKILMYIERYCNKLIANQEKSGGWAHGRGHKIVKPEDYVELTAVGNFCLLALGMAKRVGVKKLDATIAKAVAQLKNCTLPDGSLAYTWINGPVGDADPGRNAAAAFAINYLNGGEKALAKKLANYFQENIAETINGHPAPSWHLIPAALCSLQLGDDSWRDFYSRHRNIFLSLPLPDGSFTSFPTTETRQKGGINQDRMMGKIWNTAVYTLIMQLHRKKLTLLLGDPEKK